MGDLHTKYDHDLIAADERLRLRALPRTGQLPGCIPGSILVDGRIIGAWQRQQRKVTRHPFSKPTARVREAIDWEALSIPISGPTGPNVIWDSVDSMHYLPRSNGAHMKRTPPHRLRLAALLVCVGLLAGCGAQGSPAGSPSTSISPFATATGSVVPSNPALAHLDGQLVFDHVANHFVSIWIDDGTGAHELFPQDRSEQEKASWWSDGATLTFDRLLDAGARIFRSDAGAAPAEVATGCEAPECLEDGYSALSPDGTRLAFRRIEGSSDPTATRIVVADASGANPMPLPSRPWSEGEYKSPRWSPDGAFVVFAFQGHKDADGDVTGSTLYIFGMADGSLRQLTPDGLSAATPDWSGSGLIVFATDPSQANAGTKDIYVIAPDGSGMRNVTEGSPVAGSAITPHWIPGTDQIVFSHISGVITADIWVINADGTGAQQVTATGGEDTYPAVSAG